MQRSLHKNYVWPKNDDCRKILMNTTELCVFEWINKQPHVGLLSESDLWCQTEAEVLSQPVSSSWKQFRVILQWIRNGRLAIVIYIYTRWWYINNDINDWCDKQSTDSSHCSGDGDLNTFAMVCYYPIMHVINEYA